MIGLCFRFQCQMALPDLLPSAMHEGSCLSTCSLCFHSRSFHILIPIVPMCAHPVLLLTVLCVCMHRQLPQQNRLWLPRPRKKLLQSRRMCLLSSSQQRLKLTGCLRRLKRRLPPWTPRKLREDAKQVVRSYSFCTESPLCSWLSQL